MNTNGHTLELEWNERVCYKNARETVFANKRILVPKDLEAIAVVFEKDRYKIAYYDSNTWSIVDTTNISPDSSYVLELPQNSDTPYAGDDGDCAYIESIKPNVVFPDSNSPLIIVTSINNKTEYYVFVPDKGWYSISRLFKQLEKKAEQLTSTV